MCEQLPTLGAPFRLPASHRSIPFESLADPLQTKCHLKPTEGPKRNRKTSKTRIPLFSLNLSPTSTTSTSSSSFPTQRHPRHRRPLLGLGLRRPHPARRHRQHLRLLRHRRHPQVRRQVGRAARHGRGAAQPRAQHPEGEGVGRGRHEQVLHHGRGDVRKGVCPLRDFFPLSSAFLF